MSTSSRGAIGNKQDQVSTVANQDNVFGVKSFDSVSAIAGLYLWLLFGFFTSLLGCDLQRIMTQNIYVKHLMALTAFFFLMSVVDTDNQISLGMTWLKTFVVYILFMISIKSKILASGLFIALLLVDQSIKVHMAYLERTKAPQSDIAKYNKVRFGILISLIVVAFVGFIAYFIKQYSDHAEDFSFLIFFFGSNKCEGV